MKKRLNTLRRYKHDDGGVRFKWVMCARCGRKMRVAGYAEGGICSKCCIKMYQEWENEMAERARKLRGGS